MSLALAVDNTKTLPGNIIPVDEHSSQEEILAAVDAAGEHLVKEKPEGREYDWKHDGEIEGRAHAIYRRGHVRPSDICLSPNKAFMDILKDMVQRRVLWGSASGTHLKLPFTPEEEFLEPLPQFTRITSRA